MLAQVLCTNSMFVCILYKSMKITEIIKKECISSKLQIDLFSQNISACVVHCLLQLFKFISNHMGPEFTSSTLTVNDCIPVL